MLCLGYQFRSVHNHHSGPLYYEHFLSMSCKIKHNLHSNTCKYIEFFKNAYLCDSIYISFMFVVRIVDAITVR